MTRTLSDPENPWRETVRAIFDRMHFGTPSIFTGSKLTRQVVAMIEERHPDYFCEGKTIAEWAREPPQ